MTTQTMTDGKTSTTDERKMKTKKYRVEIWQYPETFEIEANSKSEARGLAKQKVNYAVWESKVEVLN